MSHKAVDENVVLIQFIPKEHIDNESAMRAVKEDGMLLRFIPKELMTLEMVVEAFLENVHTPHNNDYNWGDYQYFDHLATEYANYIKTKQHELCEFIDKDLFDRASKIACEKINKTFRDAEEEEEEFLRECNM
jgi:hypothetical protein